MKFLMRAMLFVLAFSGAATKGATPPPESAAELAKTWQGKSVVLTARPMGRFMAWTRRGSMVRATPKSTETRPSAAARKITAMVS